MESLLPLIDALGWTLLHSLWQGALIAVVLMFALTLLRDASAAARYALVCGGFALMAVAPIATFLVVHETANAGSYAGGALRLAADTQVLASPEAGFNLFATLERFLPLTVALWCFGVVARGTRVAVAWRRASNFLAEGTRAPDAALLRRFDSLVEELLPRLRPVLMISDRVSVPAVVGWLRPMVLLPTSALAGLSPVQLELILAHELAHIRRHDYLVNVLQIVLETLMFYHPAVHWMSRTMRDLREECCDDIVVGCRGERVAYARALADLEGMRHNDGMVCMAATGGRLFDRITRIALPRQHRGHAPWATGLIITTTAAIVATAGGHLVDHRDAEPVAERAAASAGPVATLRASDSYAPIDAAAGSSPLAEFVLPSISARSEDASAGPAIEARPLSAAPLALDLDAMHAEVSAAAPAPVSSIVLPPTITGGDPIAMEAPVYPERLRDRGVGAVVDFSFTVQADGTVGALAFDDQTPEYARFREAVADAVEGWRFEPYRADGVAIEQRVEHSIAFEVEAQPQMACGRITGSRVCRSPRTTEEVGVSVIYRGAR